MVTELIKRQRVAFLRKLLVAVDCNDVDDLKLLVLDLVTEEYKNICATENNDDYFLKGKNNFAECATKKCDIKKEESL